MTPPANETDAMTHDEFWSLITLLDRDRIDDDSDEDPVTGPLITALATKEPGEIRSFDDVLSELLYDLDGQAYAISSGVCGEFEDLFLYCRCCAVASGKDAYETILANPDLMPDGMEFEDLLYVAEKAFRRRTGEEYAHEPAFSLEMGANASNWPS